MTKTEIERIERQIREGQIDFEKVTGMKIWGRK